MTVKFLAPEWLERTLALSAGQPELPGAHVRVQHVVTGGPQKESRYYWLVEDGRLVGAGTGTLDDAEMTWTTPYNQAVEILKGELDPGAAFMRGTVKVAGDMGKVLTLLPLLATDAYRRLASELASETEFS